METPISDEAGQLLLAIKADHPAGHQLLADAWPGFFRDLCGLLHQDGREEPSGLDDLRRFFYPEATRALSSFYARLKQLKQQVKWDEALGPAPLRLVLHWDQPADSRPPCLGDSADPRWNTLAPETPYLTSTLLQKWPEVAEHQKLRNYRPGAPEDGLAPLLRTNQAQGGRPEPLFPHRRLPLAGKLTPCFYCGMTNHEPAACPGKMLTLQSQGLATVGYLPLEQLAELFQESMARQGELNNLLAAGVSPPQLRKDHLLRTYVSYFDLNKVYQPRFLAGIAFSLHSRWQELGRPEALAGDNSSLHLGLDCLRVGQYRQADELFIAEGRRPKGKILYATVGRALVSLEQKRHHDMGSYLENALKMAITDKDRIYLCLLLARYYRMLGESWKATQALDNILSFDRQCPEAIYRQVQQGVADGFANQSLSRLRSLIGEEKDIFIQTLIDPELLPIHDAVEEILRARLASQRIDAEENLAKARVTCNEMVQWLEEGDEELKVLQADLAIIEEHENRQSYYDLIDIAEKSRRLAASCYKIQEGKLEELQLRLEKTAKQMAGFQRFWKNYPYQSFFPQFGEKIAKMEEVVHKGGREGASNLNGTLYRALINSLNECDQQFNQLKELALRMVWVQNLVDAGKRFLKTLLVTEVILISLSLVLLVLLLLLSGDSPTASGLTQILRDPVTQKRLLLTVTLVFAPVIALAHTLWRTLDSP